jgi:hypothetical protein
VLVVDLIFIICAFLHLQYVVVVCFLMINIPFFALFAIISRYQQQQRLADSATNNKSDVSINC